MNEVNAISTSEGDKTPPAAGCPDAKREGSQPLDSSAAPLPGRRCSFCGGYGVVIIHFRTRRQMEVPCAACIGERSDPGNGNSTTQK